MVILIQETKMEELKILQMGKHLLKNNEGIETSSRDASWGILILFNTSKIGVEVSLCLQHWILIQFQHMDLGMHFTLINVYIHIRYVGKVGCWDSLKSIRECLPLNSCIIVRYFNTILSSSEKRGFFFNYEK